MKRPTQFTVTTASEWGLWEAGQSWLLPIALFLRLGGSLEHQSRDIWCLSRLGFVAAVFALPLSLE